MSEKESSTHRIGSRSKTGIFSSGDIPFTMKKEYDSISLETAKEVEVTELDRELTNLLQTSLTFATQKDATTFNKLQRRRIKFSRAFKELSDYIEEDVHMDRLTEFEIYTNCALQAGTEFLLDDLLTREQAFLRSRGYAEQTQRYYDLSRYALVGELDMRIGDNTLREIMTGAENIPPASLYRTFMEAYMLRDAEKHEEFFAQNVNEINSRYPNRTKIQIDRAATQISALCNIAEENIRTYTADSGSIDQEIKEWSKRYVKKGATIRRKLKKTLLQPASPGFSDLKKALQQYMNQDYRQKVIAMHALGLNDFENITEVYRESQALIKTNHPEKPFYEQLAQTIYDYTIETAPSIDILTKDDIDTFIDQQRILSPEEIPTLQNIARVTREIQSASSQKVYTVQPENISWINMIPPQEIQLFFDPNRPVNFYVLFRYKNPEEEEEQMDIITEIKTTKKDQGIEINFIEDQEDIPEVYQLVMKATYAVLQDAKRQALEKKEERKATKRKPVSTNAQRVKERDQQTENIVFEAPKEKVKTRPENPVSSDIDTTFVKSEYASDEKQRQQLVISDEGQKRIQKQLERLSAEDQQSIRNAIEQFNTNGLGKFYQLRGPGKSVYVLRAKANARGGSRILAKRIEGTNTFTIMHIGYRKDIYKEHDLI